MTGLLARLAGRVGGPGAAATFQGAVRARPMARFEPDGPELSAGGPVVEAQAGEPGRRPPADDAGAGPGLGRPPAPVVWRSPPAGPMPTRSSAEVGPVPAPVVRAERTVPAVSDGIVVAGATMRRDAAVRVEGGGPAEPVAPPPAPAARADRAARVAALPAPAPVPVAPTPSPTETRLRPRPHVADARVLPAVSPRRAQVAPAAPVDAQPTVVHVTIGRVEVRATPSAPAAPVRGRAPATPAVTSLDAYLRMRAQDRG